MIQTTDKSDIPDLRDFPSAQAQDGMPVKGAHSGRPLRSKRAFKPFRFLFRFSLLLLALIVLAGGGLYYTLSRGPVSNDHMRAQIENQLSAFLGEGRSVSIGQAKLAFDQGGLLAIDADEVKIIGRDGLNLGVAGEIAVRVKPFPLLKGQLETQSIKLKSGAIALAPFLPAKFSIAPDDWPKFLDLKKGFLQFGSTFAGLVKSFEDAGLDGVSLSNTKLVGFDLLGLRSQTARLKTFKLERNVNFQSGLFFSGTITAETGDWDIKGGWRFEDDGTRGLSLTLSGMNMGEFFPKPKIGERDVFYMDSPVDLSVQIPFDTTGQPMQSVAVISLDAGAFNLGKDHHARLKQAQINLRFLPKKNQIELERSPVAFENSTAVLIGGVRYPQTADSGELPLFEIIANNIEARGMFKDAAPALGVAQISGTIDAAGKTFDAHKVLLRTSTGSIQGSGSLGVGGETPNLKLDLKAAKLSTADLKQLWPSAVATKAREWAVTGITGGTIKDAWVKSNIPPGILGRLDQGARLKDEHISAELPLEGAQVETYGDIPAIRNAKGTVQYTGMDTLIQLDSGTVVLPGKRKLTVSKSTLAIGDHSQKKVASKLSLALRGTAASLAELGKFDSLGFTKHLGIQPRNLVGNANADVSSTFNLPKGGGIADVDWTANLNLTKVASTEPLFGRTFDNANLTIKAKPGLALIDGSANVDGIPAKLALVEPLGKDKAKAKRDIRLVLDNAARKKMGIDTSDILSGPVEVAVKLGSGGSQNIDVNLRNAKLSLPWLGWVKGKGIAGKASFTMKQSKGLTRLSNFTIEGNSFGARGNLVLDRNGLASAELKRVVLNKSDSFNVSAKRIKGGYDIDMSAKSYDGRALIRSFLNNDGQNSAGGSTVNLRATIARLQGFRGQSLGGVAIDYRQRRGRVSRAVVTAVAEGGAPTLFRLEPKKGGMAMEMNTANAGSILRFLDLYSKVRGGSISANLVRGKGQVFNGLVVAENFVLLEEPRLGSLLAPAGRAAVANDREGRFLTNSTTVRKKVKANPNRANVARLTARVSKGPGTLTIKKGRVQGGDAAAAFEGTVYDRNNKMNIKGTYLPARGLNRIVANIPLVSQILGRGKTKGIFGVTFRLRGPYKNPTILLNPISLIAPGVFRKLFEF